MTCQFCGGQTETHEEVVDWQWTNYLEWCPGCQRYVSSRLLRDFKGKERFCKSLEKAKDEQFHPAHK